jgi:hypothetical protein
VSVLGRLSPARPGGSLLVVVLLLTAGGAAAVATEPGPDRDTGPAARGLAEVAVARAGGACPDPVVGDATASRLALAGTGPVVRDGGRTSARPGRAVLVAAGGGRPVVQVRAPGAGTAEAEPDAGPQLLRATGRAAPGVAASQVTRSTDVAMRGLAGTDCALSGTEFWFVGSGAQVGQRGRVYLTNAEAAPALVDITLYGPDGPVDAPDGEGIAVAAGEQEVRLLDALAPGTELFGVSVTARQGRISAAVRDQQVDGLTPLGADWLPAASAPAREVVVPGVPAGAGDRLLQVVAPGDSDAIVRVRLVGEAGGFAPTGLEVIEVPARSVAEVDLAAAAGGEAVTVELESDTPVTAGVLSRVTGTTGDLGEITYAAAAEPLTSQRPGVVPEVRQGVNVSSRLLLTAPGDDVTVEVAPLPPATGTATEVLVPGGSQVTVELAAVSSAETFAVSVTPTDGPVYAVRQIDEVEQRGPLVTSSPVRPGRYVVPVPRVVADLSTGLRAGG